jgi:hypothetical protein
LIFAFSYHNILPFRNSNAMRKRGINSRQHVVWDRIPVCSWLLKSADNKIGPL